MISDLDDSLKAMLTGEAGTGSELATAPILLAAPDSAWRGATSTLAPNAYLYHVSDDRQLRSNEPRVHITNGSMLVEPYPARVQCTYLITAWNRAAAVGGVEQEKQEHRLLSQVLTVLLRNPLMPRPYLQGLLANQEIDPPLVAAEEDGATTSADFWSGFGNLPPAVDHVPDHRRAADRARREGPDDDDAALAGRRRRRAGSDRRGGDGRVGGAGRGRLGFAWTRHRRRRTRTRTAASCSRRSHPARYTLTVRAAGYEDEGVRSSCRRQAVSTT